jgi:hypothetical protein
MASDDLRSRSDLLSYGIVDVRSRLPSTLPRHPVPAVDVVQISQPLADGEYLRLAQWRAEHPSVTLRAWGSLTDLEFLRFFPKLQRFSADTFYDPVDFDGLRHLRSDLHSLGLGSTPNKPSLRPLARFTGLRRLYLEGHSKHIEVLAGLTSLRSLTLRSITLPDLSLLSPLTELRALELKLGGTRDLGLLSRVGRLEYLELWMVRGLDDLEPIASLTALQCLFLQALKQVTALPDLSCLKELRRVDIETMKGLADLAPLMTAPALEKVSLIDMGHLQPADVGLLAGHPTLRCLTAGLNSVKKNSMVKELVPLPDCGQQTLPAVVNGD